VTPDSEIDFTTIRAAHFTVVGLIPTINFGLVLAAGGHMLSGNIMIELSI
jgi:hypothetical protein